MPFFVKYQPVRLEDSDDLESAGQPPQYSENQPLITPDGKIVIVIDEKKLKRRRRCASVLKWILIIWAVSALVRYVAFSDDEPHRHRHHGHHHDHDRQPELQKQLSRFSFAKKLVDPHHSVNKVKSSCSDDDEKEVFTFVPEDGAKTFGLDEVSSLSLELRRLVADAVIAGGNTVADPSIKVALEFESDIADVFGNVSYVIQLEEGVLGVQTTVDESYKVKGCLIAHLKVYVGDVAEPDDENDGDEPEEGLGEDDIPFESIELNADMGSFVVTGIDAFSLEGNVALGAILVADSSIDEFEANVSAGLIAGDNLDSIDVEAEVGLGVVAFQVSEIDSIEAIVQTGNFQLTNSSIDDVSAAVGLGRVTIENGAASKTTVINVKVDTGSANIKVDGDHFYGAFKLKSSLGSVTVTDDGTDVPIEIDEPENPRSSKRKVSGTKGEEGEGEGLIEVAVGLGSASLNFVKLPSDE